jgi:hypothetical protein
VAPGHDQKSDAQQVQRLLNGSQESGIAQGGPDSLAGERAQDRVVRRERRVAFLDRAVLGAAMPAAKSDAARIIVPENRERRQTSFLDSRDARARAKNPFSCGARRQAWAECRTRCGLHR